MVGENHGAKTVGVPRAGNLRLHSEETTEDNTESREEGMEGG